jgi:methanethiol oxidase
MAENGGSHCCGPGYASPAEAMKAPREKILYTVALYIGTGIQKPDYLATIDADPDSPTYSQVISRLEMPGIGDELHHMGWNACSSCHHDATKQRRYLIVPGVRSSNLHIVDCGIDPKAPRSRPRPIFRPRIPCTASAPTSSSRCSATHGETRLAASFT